MKNTEEAKRFAKSLGQVLKYLNMSQAHFAKLIGITPAALSQIINGKREPSLSTVIKIVDAIYPTFEEMISGDV
jgi:predicted transcriptional regulator